MNQSVLHETYMKEAIKIAYLGEGMVSPNPLVGAVLVSAGGDIIATGYHGERGKWHAERVVFQKIEEEGKQNFLHSSTLYVTLEPCCHYGKTPPCTDAVLESKVPRIVVGTTDPNPQVAGKGIDILKQSGKEVIEGVCEKEAKHLIRFFSYHITSHLPFMVGKMAVSSNGIYAPNNVSYPFFISSKTTLATMRKKRNMFDAIMVGKKTLLLDNPELSSPGVRKSPLKRIVLCQVADFSCKAYKAFRDEHIILACKTKTSSCDFEGDILMYANAHDLQVKLFERGIYSCLVDGGGKIIQHLLQEKALNEYWIIQSKDILADSGLRAPNVSQSYVFWGKEEYVDDVLYMYQKAW